MGLLLQSKLMFPFFYNLVSRCVWKCEQERNDFVFNVILKFKGNPLNVSNYDVTSVSTVAYTKKNNSNNKNHNEQSEANKQKLV